MKESSAIFEEFTLEDRVNLVIEKAYIDRQTSLGKPVDQTELEDFQKRMVWTVVDGVVYDITNFVDKHPGGKAKILKGVSKDSTIEFHKFHPGL